MIFTLSIERFDSSVPSVVLGSLSEGVALLFKFIPFCKINTNLKQNYYVCTVFKGSKLEG